MPFALWKQPAALAAKLHELIAPLPAARIVAVTMTGELCDCFSSRRAGVLEILKAVAEVARTRHVVVWQHERRFVGLREARARPELVGSANWLALATFAAGLVPEQSTLLIDVGSTTTDIIPIKRGRPVPTAREDRDRLLAGELVYSGVRRTPVCAVLGARGAAELFATMLDVYLILGHLPEDAMDCDTADGRPATKAAAHARLARMLCADIETTSDAERVALARTVHRLQVRALRRALMRVLAVSPEEPRVAVVSGSGEFLARKAIGERWPCYSLGERLGPSVSQAACAFAVASLAARSHGLAD
jgi:probable H4MPT-linked C1 transfer pathway protein